MNDKDYEEIVEKEKDIFGMISMAERLFIKKTEKDKPVVCPCCKAEITYLDNLQSGILTYHFDKDEHFSVPNILDFETDNDFNVWVCPVCHQIIAFKYEDAVKFLKGEKNLKCEW
ncbi:MAG: hypothetical protein ACP5IV_07725 [Caldisericia bacterium]